MRGLVSLPLIIVAVLLGGIILGGVFFMNAQPAKEEVSPSPTISASPSPSPTPIPTAKPTVKPTLKATIKPSPTPSPTPSGTPVPEAPKTGCAEYNAGGDLGSLKVTIQPEEGKSLVGDAAITIKRKYDECKGVDPGFPLTQIIHQGSTTTTFSGMRPGPFKIEVTYHGETASHDVGISSGENTKTVTVSGLD